MLNRRQLIKTAVAGVSFGPVASALAKEYDPKMRFDESYDVVIVGFGGAGAAAAIAAADEGAKVLLLEKLAEGGGNTRCSGGGFIIPGNADDAYAYLSKTFEYADNEMDKESVRAFCNEAVRTKEYFAKLDPSIELKVSGHANFPTLPHADTITKYRVAGGKTGGVELFNTLSGLVAKRKNITVRFNAPAVELIRKGTEVVGLVCKDNGKTKQIKARRAVVLTTGGFEYDQETLRNFALGPQIHGLGSPGNTGDGLRLAQSMGAKLWHMTSYSCPFGIEIPGKKSCVLVNMMTPGYIWVDQDGKRFTDESKIDFHAHYYSVAHFDAVNHRYPGIPCWMILDEKGRKGGPITHFSFGYISVSEGYRWSKDCEAEIKAGIVKKAETVEGLAKEIGVPPENLKKTVQKWNTDIAKGKDEDFGRLVEKPKNEKASLVGLVSRKLSAPLDQGPYYAVKMYPALLNTQGGPRRNANGQLLDVFNKPIGRLYAAGELGSIWGSIYQGSSNVAECLVFGRIAGRNAAKQKPW